MQPSDKKQHLLDCGIAVFIEHGYVTSTIQDIIDRARATKGAFYNYFPSKEQFGLEAIRAVSAELRAEADDLLLAPESAPIERIGRYFRRRARAVGRRNSFRGDLIENFSAEVDTLNRAMVAAIEVTQADLRAKLARCLGEAQDDGAVRRNIEPEILADIVMMAWQGALLHMRMRREPTPLATFRRFFNDLVVVSFPP